MKHSRKKKSHKITDAVFRGKKEVYRFEVFPLAAEFEDVPAVFMISRRKTDNLGKGCHVVVLIGQTDSLAKEIKRQKRAKIVKQHEANVVSLLHEGREKQRLKIEADLKAARSRFRNGSS